MTEVEIQRLAAAGHALRPDWPAASLRTLLAGRHADRGFQDVAVALAHLAADPLTRTPARLDAAGPWWRPAAGDGGAPLPPRPAEFCPAHPGQWAHACAGCAADGLGRVVPAPSIREPRPDADRDSPGRLAARAAVDALAGG